MRRVVVTGMGGICALGSDWPTIESGLRACRNAVRQAGKSVPLAGRPVRFQDALLCTYAFSVTGLPVILAASAA